MYFENEARLLGFKAIAGVDEAGRGPLAGPLTVAACILPEETSFPEINDSKKLSPKKREELYDRIIEDPSIIYSIVIVSPETIDELNILQATMTGMQQAIEELSSAADYVLVDGNRSPGFKVPSKPIIKGDSLSYSIGAASILAKVARDRIMIEYHEKWPEYGFLVHKGYPTKAHMEALNRLGPTSIHRRSYAPVQRALSLTERSSL